MIGDMLSKEKHDVVLLQEVGGTSSLEILSSMFLLYLAAMVSNLTVNNYAGVSSFFFSGLEWERFSIFETETLQLSSSLASL